MVHLIEDHKIDIVADGAGLLCLAGIQGHLDIIKYLVEIKGYDISSLFDYLPSITTCGHEDVSKYILLKKDTAKSGDKNRNYVEEGTHEANISKMVIRPLSWLDNTVEIP